jgi:ATP-dependent Clp protease ATP-binding subunit ClpC
MYDRWDDAARKVMKLANQEAQRFNHEYIQPEHVLFALIKSGTSTANQVLSNLDLDPRRIRIEAEKLITTGPEMVTMGKLPQSPSCKNVVEYSQEISRELNHTYVGTEHLLLGLVREEQSIPGKVFHDLGLKYQEVRDEVLSVLSPTLPKPVHFLLDPGSATSEELGELYYEISKLYKLLGGAGVRFTVSDCRLPEMAEDLL